MDTSSLVEKATVVLAVLGAVTIVLVFVLSLVGDFIENWWHWLIYIAVLGAVVGAWLIFS